MRPIKFRAWDVERKTWLNEEDTYQQVVNQARWNPEVSEHFPIMQFTGLKDKNGKEIYEGDIINHIIFIDCDMRESTIIFNNAHQKSISVPHVVRYSIDHGGYELYNADYNKTSPFWAIGKRINTLEVVGNIYESKEVLS